MNGQSGRIYFVFDEKNPKVTKIMRFLLFPPQKTKQTSWPYFGVKLSCVCLKQPLTILR